MTPAKESDPLAGLFGPLVGVFLLGGLLASAEALIVPRLQLTLHLPYGRALLVQLVYYAGYLLFAWPAMVATGRWGALGAMACALALMAGGCGLLADAQHRPGFAALFAALMLLSAGVAGLQVACNGLAATTGAPTRAASRFTLLQGFNSLGTVAGPLVASGPLLARPGGGTAAWLFLGLAMLFAGLAVAFGRRRRATPPVRAQVSVAGTARLLLRRPALAGGVAAIFAYVGAEVTVGSLAVAFLLQSGTGLAPVAAGRLVSLYWGGAMLGRFAGARLLNRYLPDRLLAVAAGGAAALMTAAILLPGVAGAGALLALGLCHSIMFPVVYGLAMPDGRREMAPAATLLSMAVVGGAVVPVLTGLVADRLWLRAALLLPGTCYLVILHFALTVRARRPA